MRKGNEVDGVQSVMQPALQEDTWLLGRYHIAQAFPLNTCVYYEASAVAGMPVSLLIREAQKPDQAWHSEALQQINVDPSYLLWPLAIAADKSVERHHVVTRHPGPGWRNLNRVSSQSYRHALQWTAQVGLALAALHDAGVGGWPAGELGREAILIDATNNILLADVTLTRPVDIDTVSADCRTLVALLTHLLNRLPADEHDRQLPDELSTLIARGQHGKCRDLRPVIDTLQRLANAPLLARSLRQNVGAITHRGRQRATNQDFVASISYYLDQSGHATAVGLHVVADGMGGHMAGELASKGSVRQALATFVEHRLLPGLQGKTQELREDGDPSFLRELVAEANALVYHSRQQSGSDRGTTLTTVLVVGNLATIANVGDSRTYLLRERQLEQITQDHSLVASLVKAGELSKTESQVHPNRHQIYRSLGSAETVEIDLFQKMLRAGDRLLLCSDGLWEMVSDGEIERVICESRSPQLACDRLVVAANAQGGEDNISAILIQIE